MPRTKSAPPAKENNISDTREKNTPPIKEKNTPDTKEKNISDTKENKIKNEVVYTLPKADTGPMNTIILPSGEKYIITWNNKGDNNKFTLWKAIKGEEVEGEKRNKGGKEERNKEGNRGEKKEGNKEEKEGRRKEEGKEGYIKISTSESPLKLYKKIGK